MNAALIMFGIEAGVRLGRKTYDVLVDANVERPLLLPVGNLDIDVSRIIALDYFMVHSELVAAATARKPAGPYHGFSEDELVLAYKTLHSIDERLSGQGGELRAAVEIVENLDKFEQYKRGFASKPALRKILATVLEIGIDYFITNPSAMGRDSNARKITYAFLAELDETDFAEGSRRKIVGDLLGASLRALDSKVSLIEDDKRTQSLLGGVTKALIADFDAMIDEGASEAKLAGREALFQRIGSSVLRGAASAFTEDVELFVRDDKAKTLVQSTLKQVLKGIESKPNLFTNETVEVVYKSALIAVAENSELLTDNEFVEALIGKTVKALADGQKLFSEEIFGAVLQAALETLRDNAELLLDPEAPQQQLLANAIEAMAGGLASTLAKGGTAKDLLSKTQLLDLTRAVFKQVAMHPEHLIGAESDDVKMSALAQIIGSVAGALGETPGLLVTGEGFTQLVKCALHVAVLNADKLIDFDVPDTGKNLLFAILHELAIVIEEEANDPRGLVTREVFLEIAERVLPLVSANLEILLEGEQEIVRDTVMTALDLASDALEGRTNGDNLPALIEELLRRVLWNELKLNEDAAVLAAANEALRHAI